MWLIPQPHSPVLDVLSGTELVSMYWSGGGVSKSKNTLELHQEAMLRQHAFSGLCRQAQHAERTQEHDMNTRGTYTCPLRLRKSGKVGEISAVKRNPYNLFVTKLSGRACWTVCACACVCVWTGMSIHQGSA